jgi:hypothetical protein
VEDRLHFRLALGSRDENVLAAGGAVDGCGAGDAGEIAGEGVDAAQLNEIQIATGADARRLERRGPAALRDDVRADLIARGNQAGGRGVEAAAPASGAVRESTGEEGPEKHSAWLRSHGVANRLVAFEGRRKPVWAQAPPWCLSASRAGAGRYVGRPDSFLVRQDCPLRIIH